MLSEENRTLTGFAYVVIAVFAGLLTWLCVGWFGNQPLVTALMAILLVELCLACFGVIVMLLAERMTVTMMKAEGRPAAPKRIRLRREPIWLRLPDPTESVSNDGSQASGELPRETIAFPGGDRQQDNLSWHGRAA